MKKSAATPQPTNTAPSLTGLLKPYAGFISALVLCALLSNGLNLSVPKLLAKAIDSFLKTGHITPSLLIGFFVIALSISLFVYLQNVLQTYTAERVAKDLRAQLIAKISGQDQVYIQSVGASTLLTNLTSDVDAVKLFIAQAIASIVSSLLIIIGASILLLSLNWKLALAVLLILPLIAGFFSAIFGKVGQLFKRAQQIIDSLNKIINESILGAALIRVLNAQSQAYDTFMATNSEARENGLKILRLFASLIPIITFIASMAMLVILGLGGRFIILGQMTLGELAAFNSYVSMLIFPIFMLGFMSSVIGRATASFKRISDVLVAPEKAASGTRKATLRGDLEVRDVSLTLENHPVLKDVSFSVKAGTKTAILGPTAAGKTQLLYLLTGLLAPTSGEILYDGHPLADYDKQSFHQQIGFVFQDSVMFNLSVRENIAFSETVTEADFKKAVQTAELSDFIDTLPAKFDTVVSERGTTLSGGQKQRVMLARALSVNPQVLFLDDFTARIDADTERRILANIEKNYPDLTLISVTQKIASVEHYDHICVLMEGELIAQGTHAELTKSSPEYMQILQSQQSTTHYEDHA